MSKEETKRLRPKTYSRFDLPPKVKLTCLPSEGRTKQSFKEDSDINTIVGRYTQTGIFGSGGGTRQAQWGDFSQNHSYQESLNAVITAKETFASLPSDLRSHFGNDPGKLLDFIGDPKNKDEAIEMGLIPEPEKKIEAPPTKVEIVPPPKETPKE